MSANTQKSRHPKTEHLKPYQWKKGQPSPNPSGRPKKKPFQEEIEKLIAAHPEEVTKAVKATFRYAKAGSVSHFRELADRTDGPVQQRIEVDVPVLNELAERMERARKRAKR